MVVYGHDLPMFVMFSIFTHELTTLTCRPHKLRLGMASLNNHPDFTIPNKDPQHPVKPIASRVVDPNEREPVENPLPQSTKPNLEVEKNIKEEVGQETNRV